MSKIRDLLAATHDADGCAAIGRDARGISIVLLYASYEWLLVSICRSLLETVQRVRVGAKRLQPGFQLFAICGQLQSLTGATEARIWKDLGMAIVAAANDPKGFSISPDRFPVDGTKMKRTQVRTLCRVFGLGDPAPVLVEIWERIDAVVAERNGIAHGRISAEEVGRRYSIDDLRGLVDMWSISWERFIAHVEVRGSSRDFYRRPR